MRHYTHGGARQQSVVYHGHYTMEEINPADNISRVLSVSSCAQVLGRWWGTERVDYSVQSPHAVGMVHTQFVT